METLEQAGVPKDQARAFSSAVQKSHEAANLATKDDLDKVEASLRYEISDLRKDIDAKFASAEAKQEALRKDIDAKLEKLALRLIIWLGGIVFATVNAGPFIFKLFHLS